jgi:hypothetical protein
MPVAIFRAPMVVAPVPDVLTSPDRSPDVIEVAPEKKAKFPDEPETPSL